MALDTYSAPTFFTSLAENADQVFFAYDIAAKRFTYLNPAFERVWRKKRKSVMDNPGSLFKLVHPEDQQHVKQVYQELLEGIIVSDVEFRILLRNKTQRWVCVKPVLLEEEGLLSGYLNDITIQKQYNDTLKKYSDKKNAILNILSHDLAGPLGLINNIAGLLASDLKSNGNQDVLELISIIQRSSQQGTQLIQEFVKQEFLESANVELIKRRVNLVKAFRESLEQYQQTQQLTQKTFHFHSSSESIYLELDDNKFMQVINNLISNSLKFTPDGGEITVSLEEKETTVLIQVQDTGIGIPAKYHATLFDKFTRARRPGIKGEPSVGLGMSIIKTIVEWHQGHIWFESQENQGTTFYIEIPKN
ncbi:MAG: PAS domain-containing sensor histidine kinase [Cytophagales bacterium CG18_big_fil_WC_8_21_14_2_50_42_9]|nr:MAG: PAS domain-containing sensor histidine kinase [Cytophagales bacterium CG18_big_fil_WC_8_21_14_2_50_42_9]